MADTPDLPELPASIKRKLALQWSALLDAHHFTGEQFRLHDEARARRARELDRRWRLGSLAGNRFQDGVWSWVDEADQETVVDDTGLAPSVALAVERFNGLAAEYWPLWSSSKEGYTVFADWLDTIKKQVSTGVASAWKGGAEFHDRWYRRACHPAIESALAALVKEGTQRALADELKRLEVGETAESVVGSGEPEEPQGTPAPLLETQQPSPIAVTEVGAGDIALLTKPDGTIYLRVNYVLARKYLGLQERQVRNLVSSGVLRVEKVGTHTYITVESLLEYRPSNNYRH